VRKGNVRPSNIASKEAKGGRRRNSLSRVGDSQSSYETVKTDAHKKKKKDHVRSVGWNFF